MTAPPSRRLVALWLLVAGCSARIAEPAPPRPDGGHWDVLPWVPPGESCAPALGPAPGPRPSSMRQGDCDWGEASDYLFYDCAFDPCHAPPQTGDQRCHRRCDDGMCAAGERCEQRPVYSSDTPTRYLPLCMCPTGTCQERGPGGMPWPPEGGLAPWQAQPDLPSDRYYHAAAAGAGWLFTGGGLKVKEYVAGGASAILESPTTIFAAPLSGRTLGAWKPAGDLPAPLVHPAFAVTRGRLYLAGGQMASSRQFTAEVQSAVIGADGTLGPWRLEAALPQPRAWHRLLVAGDRLVVAGGTLSTDYSSNGTALVWAAGLGADGVLERWRIFAAPAPGFYDGGVGVASGRIYLLGEDGVLHSARPDDLDHWRDENPWKLYRGILETNNPTDPNMGPVHLFGSCGALVALVLGGNALTAPLDGEGRVGAWRNASRFYGTPHGYATAATDEAIFAIGAKHPGAPPPANIGVFSTGRE